MPPHSSQSGAAAPSSSSSHQSVPMDLSYFDLGEGAEFDESVADAYDPAPAGESYAAMASHSTNRRTNKQQPKQQSRRTEEAAAQPEP